MAVFEQTMKEETKAALRNDFERMLKTQICPQCKAKFELCWNDYGNKPETLILRGCPSGGIYNVEIRCPECDYEEEL